MAIGAIESLSERGITVPYDVAVVGFDNIPSARFLGLTTVSVPMREMGRVAARLAFDLVDGKIPVGSEILQTEIIQRTSTRIDALNRPLTVHHTTRF
ncbi:MAG: HTH-type transcriptional repressor CytR [Verrucomicrobia bacterium ADurb.Bin345]|nr:MAG: HTH-type transcriptional repressor CytR [Verrucomicrobia bacterium ADurb.Bin345]